jgi:hypothetical protein
MMSFFIYMAFNIIIILQTKMQIMHEIYKYHNDNFLYSSPCLYIYIYIFFLKLFRFKDKRFTST